MKNKMTDNIRKEYFYWKIFLRFVPLAISSLQTGIFNIRAKHRIVLKLTYAGFYLLKQTKSQNRIDTSCLRMTLNSHLGELKEFFSALPSWKSFDLVTLGCSFSFWNFLRQTSTRSLDCWGSFNFAWKYNGS